MSQDDLPVPMGEVFLSTRLSEDAQRGFFMSKRDWRKLRQHAERIRPTVAWWSVVASGAGGLAAACLVNWLIAKGAATPDRTVIAVNLVAWVSSAVLTLACVIADNQQRAKSTQDAQMLIEEMDWIEENLPDVFVKQRP